MKMFLDTVTHNKPITIEDLKHLLQSNDEVGPLEIIGLVDIDDKGNLHFAIKAYGIYN